MLLFLSPVDAVMFFDVGEECVNDEVRKTSVFLPSQFLKEGFKLSSYFESDHDSSHALVIQSLTKFVNSPLTLKPTVVNLV